MSEVNFVHVYVAHVSLPDNYVLQLIKARVEELWSLNSINSDIKESGSQLINFNRFT